MEPMKTFSDLALTIEREQRAEQQRQQLERIDRKRAIHDDAVVCGVYRPEPVDREAAMLLARAPWWAFAPSVRKDTKQEDMAMGTNGLNVATGAPPKGEYRELLGDVDCTDALVKQGKEVKYDIDKVTACFLRHIEEKYPPKMSDLARAALDTRAVLDEHTRTIGAAMDEFERVTRAAMQQVRTHRMTTVTECASVVNALKDVRQFFLGPDYEREQKRLAEFVDLCERMKKLKDSGFLDTVADTMIRLASVERTATT